ncbi:hypothetical protein [Roseobacter sp.]|uniref:hypothetical protein n=1 Tax=Roseobacter sp. TaxID=1907202 RepID=UPI0025DBAB04|nr:hypothetical protein [Roseobacter sp.]
MEPDLALVIGLFFIGLSILLTISALTASRSAAAGIFAFITGTLLVGFAFVNVHGSYSIAEIPQILMSVVSRYLM